VGLEEGCGGDADRRRGELGRLRLLAAAQSGGAAVWCLAAGKNVAGRHGLGFMQPPAHARRGRGGREPAGRPLGARRARTTLAACMGVAYGEMVRRRVWIRAQVQGDVLVTTVHRDRERCHVDTTTRTCARASATSMSPDPILFRDSVFKIMKLQKVSSYLKISKNKSCRGAIDLQLSQRVTYVLIN
jgi:hypothetical protein